jgi:hypothetical protein
LEEAKDYINGKTSMIIDWILNIVEMAILLKAIHR